MSAQKPPMVRIVARRSVPVDKDLHIIHRQAADWLILLREEPDDATAKARFESWLDEDPAHALAWVSVSDIFDTIREAGPELEAQWRHPKNDGVVAPRRSRRPWMRGTPATRRAIMAGSIAAAIALIWAVPSALLRIQSDHITSAGELETVSLADGSTVRLGPESAISVDYRTSERTIRLLAGQAWFDVKRNPNAPFRVMAGDVQTTVLGTRFDVRRIGAMTAASVAQGKVQVVDHGIAPANARILTAGHWVRVGADHEIESGTDNPTLFGEWRDGRLIARNRPIAELIDELRPWYGGRIILLNRAVGRKRIDGVFDARNPASALKAIAQQGGGTAQGFTPWLMIVS